MPIHDKYAGNKKQNVTFIYSLTFKLALVVTL